MKFYTFCCLFSPPTYVHRGNNTYLSTFVLIVFLYTILLSMFDISLLTHTNNK